MAAEPRKRPKVYDLSLDEAQLALRGQGLGFTVQLVQNQTVPEGNLLGVAPRPGALLEDGTTIVLQVSSGPPGTVV
jgi:eukaryotic-like serine/threonine-protein kinase